MTAIYSRAGIRELIDRAMELAGSEAKLAEKIGVRVETVRHWVGCSVPSLNALKCIEEFVSKESWSQPSLLPEERD